MTPQKIFDTAAVHLLDQGEKAENIEGCAYRGDHGTQCAIGCLIPDDMYDPIIEMCTPFSGSGQNGAIKLDEILVSIGIEHSQKQFLNQLQDVHDEFPPSAWDSELRELAHRYQLNTNKLEAQGS